MATGGGAGSFPKRELTHKEIANKLIEEGVHHYRAGKDYEKARLSFESARDIAKRAKLELEEARALGNLANAHSNLKENIAASDLYRMSLFLFRKIGETKKEIIILKNAANVECLLKHWDEAIKLHRRRMELCSETKQEEGRLESVEEIKKCQGYIEKERMEAEVEKIKKLFSAGVSHREDEAYDMANAKLDGALKASIAAGTKRWEGKARLEKARVDLEQNDGPGAGGSFLEAMEKALPLLEESGSRDEFFDGLDELTTYYVSIDRTKEAIGVLERKVRCFDNSEQDRIAMEEVINRLSIMRAKVHKVQDLSLSSAMPMSNSGRAAGGGFSLSNLGGGGKGGASRELRSVSKSEDRLRQAEMSATRQRELMQLSFRDVSMDRIERRVSMAESSMAQLSPFLKAFAHAESSSAKILRESMGKSTFWGEKASFKEIGTLQHALSQFKYHASTMANMKERYGNDVVAKVVNPIETQTRGLQGFFKAQENGRKRRDSVTSHSIDRIKDVKLKMINIESTAEKLRRQVEALSERERESVTNPLVTRQRRKNRELSELTDQLARLHREFGKNKKEALRADMQVSDEYQRTELSRISNLREYLRGFVAIEEAHIKQRMELLEKLKGSIASIDATSDIRLFTHDETVRSLCGDKWKSFTLEYHTSAEECDEEEKRVLEVFIQKTFEKDGANSKGFAPTVTPLLEKMSHRQNLIRLMNLQRSKLQAIGEGFDDLVEVMNHFLDKCVEQNDVKGAKMMMIMSETFFRFVNSPGNERDAADPKDGNEEIREETREYLQESIKSHRIWHNQHFWEEAFFLSVREEVVKHKWQLEEKQVSHESDFMRFYKNIIFGQLGSYALNMLNFGVELQATLKFIHKLCRVNKIEPEKNNMLIENAKMLSKSKQRG
jgi:tetratricopeptide (TPR) repeat protein|eukprot:g8441.t1